MCAFIHKYFYHQLKFQIHCSALEVSNITRATMTRFIFRAICFFAVFIAITAKPEVQFYDDNTIERSTFSLSSSVNRPNLQATWKYLPEANYRVICKTGIWVFHWGLGSENYGPSSVFSNEIWMDECMPHVPNAYAGSIRFVGEVGESRRLNLYSGKSFTFDATTILENQAFLSTRFESLILVGDESVELFREPNYQGTSVCVRARQYPYTAYEDIAYLNLRPGDVQSIRFGCSPTAVKINAPPSLRRVTTTSLTGNHF